MKKLVLKTVAITLAAIILAIAAIYFCLAVFSPVTLANSWFTAGNYSVAVKYYEKQYNKTGDISDLSLLCVKIDAEKDSARAVKHLSTFINDDGFLDYCDKEDNAGGFKFSAYEYYYGKYTVARFFNDGIDAAIETANAAVSAGYTEYNAFYILMSDVKALSRSDGEKIASAIDDIKTTVLTDETEIGYAERDIALANSVR